MLMISWTLNEQSDYECYLQEVLFTLFVYGGEILRSPIDVVYCTTGRLSMESPAPYFIIKGILRLL